METNIRPRPLVNCNVSKIDAEPPTELSMPRELLESKFSTKFRWKLISDYFPDYSVAAVEVHEATNHIQVKFHDIIKITEDGIKGLDVLRWLQALDTTNDKFKLVTYAHTGEPMFSTVYQGLDICSHTTSYDYSKSELVIRNVNFKYLKAETTFYCEPLMFKSSNNVWILFATRHDDGFDTKMFGSGLKIDLFEKPNAVIEETPLDYGTGKTFLAGRAKWKPIRFKPLDGIDSSLLKGVWNLRLELRDANHGNRLVEVIQLDSAVIEEIENSYQIRYLNANLGATHERALPESSCE